LTAIGLAAVPLLLILLVILYVRRPYQTPVASPKKSKSAANASKSIQSGGGQKKKKIHKKVEKITVKQVSPKPTESKPKDLSPDLTTSKSNSSASELHAAAAIENDSKFSLNQLSQIKESSQTDDQKPELSSTEHQVPEPECSSHHSLEGDNTTKQEQLSETEVKVEKYHQVEKAFNELELQAKIMFETSKLSSGQAMAHKQENLHLTQKVKNLEKQLSNQKNLLSAKINSLENQVQILCAEKMQTLKASEHEIYHLKTMLESQISKLNQ
jgi:hypothetical protein